MSPIYIDANVEILDSTMFTAKFDNPPWTYYEVKLEDEVFFHQLGYL